MYLWDIILYFLASKHFLHYGTTIIFCIKPQNLDWYCQYISIIIWIYKGNASTFNTVASSANTLGFRQTHIIHHLNLHQNYFFFFLLVYFVYLLLLLFYIFFLSFVFIFLIVIKNLKKIACKCVLFYKVIYYFFLMK